jgi:hypothetical protein
MTRAAESLYWVALFEEAMIGYREQVRLLSNKYNQVVAIFARMGNAKTYLTLQSATRHPPSAFSNDTTW